MNRRLVTVFAFALVVAGLTSFLLYRLILLRVHAPARPVAQHKLVVAAHDLKIGALIHDADVEQVAWPGPVPEKAIKNKQDVIGRGVIAPIYENEPFLEERLAPKGAGAGLAATIPVGMRAVALRVDQVVGLAGFVLPGMRVDVLIAGNPPGAEGSRGGTLCRTVLQNIQVLSAGQKIEKSKDGKPELAQVVNLLVSPDQAEILNLASTETKVQLVLRNPLDTQEQKTSGVSLAALYGEQVKPPAPVRVVRRSVPVHHEQAFTTVEVFSGAKRTEQRFDVAQGDLK